MPTPSAGYRLADGTKVPGVTTILNRWKESGGLLQWAFAQGQSGIRSLYEKRDEAADIGTLAHAMVEHYLKGKPPKEALDGATLDQAMKAGQAFDAFRRWLDQQRAEVISIETPMISESMRIGGTPDVALRFADGRFSMGDVKTSNAVYRDHLMQVAAYGEMWNENHSDEPITGGYDILRFSNEFPDFEHRHFDDLSGALELFKLLRRAYDLDLQLKKRVA